MYISHSRACKHNEPNELSRRFGVNTYHTIAWFSFLRILPVVHMCLMAEAPAVFLFSSPPWRRNCLCYPASWAGGAGECSETTVLTSVAVAGIAPESMPPVMQCPYFHTYSSRTQSLSLYIHNIAQSRRTKMSALKTQETIQMSIHLQWNIMIHWYSIWFQCDQMDTYSQQHIM